MEKWHIDKILPEQEEIFSENFSETGRITDSEEQMAQRIILRC